MALHSQKCDVVNCFNHIDVMNAVVILTMPWTSHDADAIVISLKKAILHVVLRVLT